MSSNFEDEEPCKWRLRYLERNVTSLSNVKFSFCRRIYISVSQSNSFTYYVIKNVKLVTTKHDLPEKYIAKVYFKFSRWHKKQQYLP